MLQLVAGFLPTDKRVLVKMKELTRAGVRRAAEMRPLICDYVCNVLFAGQSAPPRFDSRFWPSDKTIRNCIGRMKLKARCVVMLFLQYLSFQSCLLNSFPISVACASIDIFLCFEFQKEFARRCGFLCILNRLCVFSSVDLICTLI